MPTLSALTNVPLSVLARRQQLVKGWFVLSSFSQGIFGLLLVRDRPDCLAAAAFLASVKNVSWWQLLMCVEGLLHCLHCGLLDAVSTLWDCSVL
jgi:hypothetical protein